MRLRIQHHTSINEVNPAHWDALVGDNDPFIEHAFLAALETSNSVGARTGWLTRHVGVYRDDLLVGAAPLYEKHNSYGEYIFDWGWAHAAERAGLPYYPKLVSAVPFTPVTGQRLLIGEGDEAARRDIRQRLIDGVREAAENTEASSVHFLFTPETTKDDLAEGQFMPRSSYQFHWRNDDGQGSFDDFLAGMRSPARKQIRNERKRARTHGLELSMRRGSEMNDADWRALRRFYADTIRRKYAIPYLTEAFFESLRSHFAHRVVAAFAHRGDRPIAGALFFHKGNALYGRYWGADEELDAMHFELCYYLPIEWALAEGVTHIEAGAQGPHKLKRGFLPRPCHSAHWIAHPGLAAAVERFLQQESAAVDRELQHLATSSPFRRV